MDDTSLTRPEAAYAHLAAFRYGNRVDVTGPGLHETGTVTTPQRCIPGRADDLTRAYLIVDTARTALPVTVADLLAGHRTITSLADAKAGNIRYFDAVTYQAAS